MGLVSEFENLEHLGTIGTIEASHIPDSASSHTGHGLVLPSWGSCETFWFLHSPAARGPGRMCSPLCATGRA